MTCDDYLSMLETLPVQELSYGEAREHAAYCPECNRVARVVAARERNMTLAYESAYPSASATTVAERAISAARRQRIAFYYRAGLALAAVLVVVAFIATRRLVLADGPAVFQRFNLQCLSSDQAATLLRQQIGVSDVGGRHDGERMVIRAQPRVSVVEVGGSREQVRIATAIIDQYDNSQQASCAAQVVVPSTGVRGPVPAMAPTAAPAAVPAIPALPPR